MSSQNSRALRATRLRQTASDGEKEPAKKVTRSNLSTGSDKSKSSRNNSSDIASPKSDDSHLKTCKAKINDHDSPSMTSSAAENTKSMSKQNEERVKTKSRADDEEVSNKMTPVKVPKGKMDEKTPSQSTPQSAVRRSGRATVPSSRFKDMEMGLGSARKRSTPSINLSEESDVEQEPVKKRGRKTSERSQGSISDNEKMKDTVKPSQANEVKVSQTGEVKDSQASEIKVNQTSEVSLNQSNVVSPRETSEVNFSQTCQEVVEITTTPEVVQGVNVPLSIEEMIQSNLEEAKLQGEPESKVSQVPATKVAESVTPIIASGITYRTEQDVVLQTPDPSQTQETVGKVEETPSSPFPSISIGGQQVTFAQRGGETVAIVTFPTNTAQGEATEEQITILPTNPGENNTTTQEVAEVVNIKPEPQSLRHGHIVSKKKPDSPFTAALIGQDGQTFYNLSIEATKISTILKGKSAAKPAPPAKGHGRVLRTEPYANVSGAVPPSTGSAVSIPSKESAQSISLVSPSSASASSDGKTYTLLTLPKQRKPTSNTQRNVVLHGSIQPPSQSHSKIVFPTPKSSLIKPDENAPTIVRVAQDLPSKKTNASTESNVRTVIKSLPDNHKPSTPPKTASEILIQRLREQQKRVIVKESVCAADNLTQQSPAHQTQEMQIVTRVKESEEKVSEFDSGNEIDSQLQGSDNSGVISSTRQDKASQPQEHTTEETSAPEELLESHENEAVVDEGMNEQLESHLTSNDQLEPTEGLLVSSVESGNVKSEREISNESDNKDQSKEITSFESVEAYESATVLTELKNMDARVIKSNSPSEHVLHGVQESIKPNETPKKADIKERVVKIVDSGVEYDVRIVSEEEVAEEVVGYTEEGLAQKPKKDITEEGNSGVIIKQEETTAVEDMGTKKQTSGTQTVYSPRVETTAPPTASDSSGPPVHRLATVVDETGGKKQIYYVSVIPNKGLLGKGRNSAYSNAANWVMSENGMYCCGKCNYKTDRKANFYKHRRLHTGAKPHVCPVCQYKAGTSSNLKRHMGIHKDIREHKCDTCGLSFRQKIHLERHVKYKHEEKSVQCPLCDYICANEQPDLKMHMKRKHSNGGSGNGEVVSCPECNIEVGSKKDLKQHMKFHKDGPELKLFCKECSFVTDCQSRLKRHAAIHSKLKPFQCGVCNYRAAQKEHVLRHLRTQHKIEVKQECKRPWKRHKTTETGDPLKERADFTSGDKIFACNHCTMRFAKLINLYKHLHTQHSDIMPSETEGNFYCVVCEFSTTSKKNLLVHMRRHNLTDQTPPTHVYSCVLCRYVSPKRRNLFQHMRKKHNIDISHQVEGVNDIEEEMESESSVIRTMNKSPAQNTASGTTFTIMDATETSVKPPTGDLAGVANMIKIEDLTRTSATGGEGDGVPELVIDTRGTNVTEVVSTTGAIQQHSAEALEGLQALAEQAGLIDNIIEEQVPVMDEQQTIVIEQPSASSEEQVVGASETVGGQLQQMMETSEGSSVEGEIPAGVELTEDQLSSLRTGDMVEMEGELYVVELTQDPNNANKQMLSFLPVSQVTLNQESQLSS